MGFKSGNLPPVDPATFHDRPFFERIRILACAGGPPIGASAATAPPARGVRMSGFWNRPRGDPGGSTGARGPGWRDRGHRGPASSDTPSPAYVGPLLQPAT